MSRRILAGLLAVLLFISCAACSDSGGASEPETELTEPEPISEPIPTETEEPEPSETTYIPVTDIRREHRVDNVYQVLLPEEISYCADFLVRGSYMAAVCDSGSGIHLAIIDLVACREIAGFEWGDGTLYELDSIAFVFLSEDGTVAMRFDDILSEPTPLKKNDVRDIKEEAEEWSEDFADYGVLPLRTGEVILYINGRYIISRYYSADKGYDVSVYGRGGELFYFGSPYYAEDVDLQCSVADGDKIYLIYSEILTDSVVLIQIDLENGIAIDRPETGGYDRGITILSGQAAADALDGHAEPVTKKSTVKYAIERTEIILDRFPTGFWDELLSNQQVHRKSLVIFLTGKLNFEEQDVSTPTGQASFDNDAYYVMVDITNASEKNPIDENLTHELMHVIDYYLRDLDVSYKGWKDALPADFSYSGSFYGKGGAAKDTLYVAGSTGKKNVWFPESYCKVSEMEDRAVLFSRMFTIDESCLQYPNVLRRMGIIADTLRKNFKSVKKNNDVRWEELLG